MNYIKFLSVLIICFFITGCGNDSLKCVKKQENEAGNSNYNIKISFRHGKVNHASVESVFKVNHEYKEYADVMASSFKNSLKNYDGKDGIETKLDTSDTEIKALVSFDLLKMAETEKKNIGFDSTSRKKDIKKFYENDGFICN